MQPDSPSQPRQFKDSAVFGALVGDDSPRWFIPTLAAACVAAVIALRKTASWDVWWHLAIGREATALGGPVQVDTFSYPFDGAPYAHTDLLADWIFFQAFQPFGHAGLAAVVWVAIMGAFFGIRLSLGRRARPVVWLLLCVAFAAAVHGRAIARPLVFTVAGFPLMLGLIQWGRDRIATHDWRPFFIAMLPAIVLQWAWLNLHRGGVVGLVLLVGNALALTLGRAVFAIRPLRPIAGPQASLPVLGIAFAVPLLAGAAGLLNASGLDLYTTTLSLTGNDALRAQISEWQPLTLAIAKAAHPVGLGLAVAAIIGLLARWGSAMISQKRTPLNIWHGGVLAVFLWQALQAVRYVDLASAAAVVVLGTLATSAIGGWERRRGSVIGAPGLIAWVIAIIGSGALHVMSPLPVGTGPLESRYPAQALTIADAMNLGPNIHNAFVYGGYTIWHEEGRRRVLIDGRNDMVYPTEFFLRCSRAQHDIQLFAELWGETDGDWVLADNTPGRETFQFLAGHPDWLTVFWSEEAIIYVLREDHQHLSNQAFRYINAAHPVPSVQMALQQADSDDARAAIRDEILRMLEASPDSIRAHALIAIYYHHIGDMDRRNAALELMHILAPEHPAVVQLRDAMLGAP